MNPRAKWVYFIEPTRATFPADATAEEQELVEQHFRYLKQLLERGNVILAGRTDEPSPIGIVVFEADSADAARAVLEHDPAVAAGLFAGRVAPFRVALLRPAAAGG